MANEEALGARATILGRIRRAHHAGLQPATYRAPIPADPISTFVAKAMASHAVIHQIDGPADVPETVFAILSATQGAPSLHVPAGSPLHQLPWHRAPGLKLVGTAPSGEAAALSAADFAIAETGTLVFLSGVSRPSSWHFLPGQEFVVLPTAFILPSLEVLFARLGSTSAMPATLNLVTGPSRTADIEQTLERGAHGPREVHILLAATS